MLGRHRPGHPERDRVRDRRDRVQPGPFLGQHLHRGPAGDPVHPGVDLLTERLAGRLQLGERARTAGSRFVSVGTRSALAIFTVDSDPPLDAGSAGTQVWTVTP